MSKANNKKRAGGNKSASPRNPYFSRARFLLETFNENRMRLRQISEEQKNMRRFTREDAIYLLAGIKAVQYEKNRVQSSGNTDGIANGAMKIDEVLERMNREAGKELEAEKQHITNKITLVNAAFGRMDDDVKRLVKMRYVDGFPVEQLTGPDGKKLDYWNAMDIIHRGVQQFADFLVRVDEIKAAAALVDREQNEYTEEWYE